MEVSEVQRSQDFFELMNTRRSVRKFQSGDVCLESILNCIRTAGTAPSGANSQPWHFSVVTSKEVKRMIYEETQRVERNFYENLADDKFIEDLRPLGTGPDKAHLLDSSVLIVIFVKSFTFENGEKKRSYYPKESVGIATGMLITALHQLGYATLTHTPSPMNYLAQILGRPDYERPFMILHAGHAHPDYIPPDITRKPLRQICSVI